MRPCCLILLLTLASPSFAQSEFAPQAPEPEPVKVLTGGWFAAAELAIVQPHVKQYPSDLLNGITLATTVSPEFSGGYRFASGRAIHFDYRFLSSSGSRDYPARPQPVGIGANDEILSDFRLYSGHATLDMHSFDLDFTFRDPLWECLPFLRTRWEIGARAVLLSTEVREPKVYDDRFMNLTQATEWFGNEKLTSSYQGGGPHFDYKLAIAIDSWGLEFFALSDVAVLFGTRTARYSPVNPQPIRNGREVGPGWVIGNSTATLVDSRPLSEHSFSCTAWNWRGDLGAKLTRPWRGRLITVAAGYRLDYWTFNAQTTGGSGFFSGAIKVPELNLDIKGAFLRFEMQF